jgi:hypothetical protein
MLVAQNVWQGCEFRREDHPRVVSLTFSFQQLSDINVIEQTFTAQVRITLQWKPTKEEWDQFQADPPTSFSPNIPGLDFSVLDLPTSLVWI